MDRTQVLAVSLCVLGLVVGAPARADTFTWNANNGDWTEPANWDPSVGGPPDEGDTGVIEGNTARGNADLYDPGAGGTPPDEMWIKTGGHLEMRSNLIEHNLVMDGGRLGDGWERSCTYSGTVNVYSDSLLGKSQDGGWRHQYLSGLVRDYDVTHSGKLIVDESPQSIRFTGAGNTWSGGLEIQASVNVYAEGIGCLGTGTAWVDAGVLSLNAGGNTTAAPILVGSGGILEFGDNDSSGHDIRVAAGGLRGQHDSSMVSNDTVSLDGTCTFWLRSNGGASWYMDGVIQDGTTPGRVRVERNPSDEGMTTLILRNANTYSGGTEIVSGNGVRLDAAGALGSGDVDLPGGALNVNCDGGLGTGSNRTVTVDGGVLYFSAAQSHAEGAQPAINIETGGTCALQLPSGTTDLDLTLDGGMLQGHPRLDAQHQYFDGTVTVSSDSYLGTGPNRNLYFTASSAITGGGRLIKSGYRVSDQSWGGTASVVLQGANAGFSGGFDVKTGYLQVDAAGGLGSGTVNVGSATLYGGRLRTNDDGSLDSPAAVNVNADGVIEIDSAETALIRLNTGGVLMDLAAGSTTYDYDPASGSRNVALQQGAILDRASLEPLGALPAYAVVAGLSTGDGAFGLYETRVGTYAEDRTFGDDGAGNIWRGLSNLNNATTAANNLTYRGAADEATGSTSGLHFWSQTGSTITYDGPNGCSLSPNAGGALHLGGGGQHVLSGTVAGTYGTVEKKGLGTLTITAANSVSGKTINVREGWIDVDDPDALNGATVNIDPASIAGYYADTDISGGSGTVNVKAGGYVRVANNAGVAATTVMNFEPGTQVRLQTSNYSGSAETLGGGGKADVVLWTNTGNWGYLPTGGIELGNGTRLAASGARRQIHQNGGDILMAADAAEKVGRITMSDGGQLDLNATVNFGLDGKVIFGDTESFEALDFDGLGTTAVSGGGLIVLSNSGHTFGKVEIAAGRVQMYQGYYLCDTPGLVHIRAGAEWYAREWSDHRFDGIIKGSGTFTHERGHRVYVRPSADNDAGLAPGDSVGILTLNHLAEHWALEALDLGGGNYKYCRFEAEVVSDGGVPGTDHDQLLITNDRNLYGLANTDLVVQIPVLPSGSLNPDALGDMTIITTGGTVSGLFHDVLLEAVDDHWQIAHEPKASAFTVEGGNVILHGSAISWSGLGGDADLNGVVDYLDLGVLATYYDKTGLGWSEGDFNFDGKVDYMDLGVLATNYDLTEGSGGTAVPEPAFAILLGAGALGLLRRRHKR